MSFQEFGKISRLRRGCVITEKIDGTNAQVFIDLADIPNEPGSDAPWVAEIGNFRIAAGSRNRWITPQADNFGFAAWVKANAALVIGLGPGRHYGEWWGAGVQRRYGLIEKRFSLFNSGRWGQEPGTMVQPACCHVVPVLYRGPFDTSAIDDVVTKLRVYGSVAAPGFMNPEGIVLYHEASRQMFKQTLDNDAQPKSTVA